MPSSRATAVTVLPEESTSAIASLLNSSVYRFVYLLPTWCYFLWNLRSQSPGVHDQGEASLLVLARLRVQPALRLTGAVLTGIAALG
nr:hypothetical protein [Streptomyces hygroscopicus]